MNMFDPSRQPPRDKWGFTFHPDLDLFTLGGVYDPQAFRDAGFELHQLPLESDRPDLLQRYYEQPDALLDWHPEAPSTQGWRLVGVYDTENEPVAVFIRPVA